MRKIMTAILVLAMTAAPIFADYKISQKLMMEDLATETTVYAKGVRQRRESRMIIEGDAQTQAMMAKMMPNLIKISQCDLKQNVSISEPRKAYFIDYYDWSGLSPEQMKRRPNQKITIRGTATVSSVVTDSGKRQEMFGLTAKWLKAVRTVESSADSCEGQASLKIEEEGWFVDLTLSQEQCQLPELPEERGGCRPKIIMKTMQNPGFFLEGTTKMYENNKLQTTSRLETTALSKAALDQSLFEIPVAYKEVDALAELMGANDEVDTSAKTVFTDSQNNRQSLKTIAIDFFSGNVSKVDQDELRGYISSKLTAAGFSGYLINSQAEIATGNFTNIIGVELKKVKESGASKIGGLFGKVTGNDDAAKLGESEAEIVITIYGKDGKTVVASMNATQKIKGKANDAVKAAIDGVLSGLLNKVK